MLITSLEQAQAEMVEELKNRETTGDSGRGGGGGGGSNKEHVPPAIKCDDCNDQLSVPPAPPTLQRQITPGSTDAIDFLLDKVMGADYHRGRYECASLSHSSNFFIFFSFFSSFKLVSSSIILVCDLLHSLKRTNHPYTM